MNKKLVFALVATALAITAIFYFKNNKTVNDLPTSNQNIIGKWTVDSIRKPDTIIEIKDSFFVSDSLKQIVEFNSDSTVIASNIVSIPEFVYTNDSLFIIQSNNQQSYAIQWLNDSSIRLKKDSSLIINLSKVK